MIAKMVIGLLLAVVLVVLYRGMRGEQDSVDPSAPLSAGKILATLHAFHLRCDNVVTYQPVGKSQDGEWDGYMALCRDGGRYIYFQNPKAKKVGAVSCKAETYQTGYRCPE